MAGTKWADCATAEQMRGAPRRAIFVWRDDRGFEWGRKLAWRIARSDLCVVPLSFLDQPSRDIRVSSIIIHQEASVNQSQALNARLLTGHQVANA